jgi:hypothetical protein
MQKYNTSPTSTPIIMENVYVSDDVTQQMSPNNTSVDQGAWLLLIYAFLCITENHLFSLVIESSMATQLCVRQSLVFQDCHQSTLWKEWEHRWNICSTTRVHDRNSGNRVITAVAPQNRQKSVHRGIQGCLSKSLNYTSFQVKFRQ